MRFSDGFGLVPGLGLCGRKHRERGRVEPVSPCVLVAQYRALWQWEQKIVRLFARGVLVDALRQPRRNRQGAGLALLRQPPHQMTVYVGDLLGDVQSPAVRVHLCMHRAASSPEWSP